MATTGVYMSLFNIFANLLQLLMALAASATERSRHRIGKGRLRGALFRF